MLNFWGGAPAGFSCCE